jgi:hypothetical protein
MRARAAYIRSLGTTSILVAAAFLMLGVVGALVGFHGWPEGAVGETVPSVPLKPAPERVLSAVRDVQKTSTATRIGHVAAGRASTTGLVKVVPVNSPQAIGYPVAVPPGQAVPGSGAPASDQPTAAQTDPGTGKLPPSSPTTPPTDPQGLQTLIDQLTGTAPPPPGSPQGGQGIEVTVPIVGVTVSVPPGSAQ